MHSTRQGGNDAGRNAVYIRACKAGFYLGPKLEVRSYQPSEIHLRTQKIVFYLRNFSKSLKLSNSDLAEKSEFEAQIRTWGPGPNLRSEVGVSEGGGSPPLSRATLLHSSCANILCGVYTTLAARRSWSRRPLSRARGLAQIPEKTDLFFFFLLASKLALKDQSNF